ncbi:arsenate reductase ArsC [Exiguobacterium sp. SH1S21]|uniref:arsenate reductase ArsC n=1 Tax=Exiguobacterium sp. SH1S21 TaxID=2510953 RepID=UPI00103F87FB|nr:arsenate reductase ArsC [Exiguobacterium sp. SH1S21]TCI56262.1 arsenate reductase ArsC [Exiguobacterium sp. SH1S21]
MVEVAFVCIHNSCRSQMAETIGRDVLGDIARVHSAGTEDYPEVKPLALEAVREIGLDPSGQHPKRLDDIPDRLDYLITMGCGGECPYVPTTYRDDWGLDDPSGQPIEAFRETRSQIITKMKQLREQILNDHPELQK